MYRITASDQLVETLVTLYGDAWTEAGGGGRRSLATLEAHLARLEVDLPAEEAEASEPVVDLCTARVRRLWVRRTPPDLVAQRLARHLLRAGAGAVWRGLRGSWGSIRLAVSPGGWQVTEDLFEPASFERLVELTDLALREEGRARLEKALAHERRVAAHDAAHADADDHHADDADADGEPWTPDPEDARDAREAADPRSGLAVDMWLRTATTPGRCEVMVGMVAVADASLPVDDWADLRSWEQAEKEHAPGVLEVDEDRPAEERCAAYAWPSPAAAGRR